MSSAAQFPATPPPRSKAEGNLPKPMPNFAEMDEEAVEAYIYDNLEAFLNSESGTEVELVTKHLPLDCQFYELKEREHLREMQRITESFDNEIMQSHNAFMASLPQELLNTHMSTLIQMADNAPNFEVMSKRLLETLGEDSDDSDYEDIDEDVSGDEDSTAASAPDMMAQLSRILPLHFQNQPQPNIALPVAPAIAFPVPVSVPPSTPHNTTNSSEEFFQTPRTHFDGTTVGNNIQTHIRGKTMVISKNGGEGSSQNEQREGIFLCPPPLQRPVSPGNVFQFVGNADKAPRPFKLGEIVYSATGSPIAVAPPVSVASSSLATGSEPECFNVTPPLQMAGRIKPVQLKVENPNGPAIQVELVCHENDTEQQELFRNFVTDVRGLITTRSMAQNKVMAPRVPASVRTTGKHCKRKCPSSSRKPQWKV